MPDDRRPDGLSRSSIHVWEDSPSSPAGIAPEPVTRSLDPELTARLDPESAARAYLEGYQDDALTSLGTETVGLTGTRTVKFRQSVHGIPVYGSFVVVELAADNALVGIDTTTGRPEDVDPIASISPAQAVEVARSAPGGYRPLRDVVPRLHFFFDGERWRLVHILEDVPVTTDGAKGADAPPSRRATSCTRCVAGRRGSPSSAAPARGPSGSGTARCCARMPARCSRATVGSGCVSHG